MGTRDHENSSLAFLTEGSTVSSEADLREKIKIEFYKTYDVMTGIRIAATLGGFFSMMILLVLYKNYCKPSKTLSEEQLNAAVTAAAEEEDRALQAALDATTFYTSLEKSRQSLENSTNQILLSPRFSSVGGGCSHLAPPMKMAVYQQRGKSLPGSVLRFGPCNSPLPFEKNSRDISHPKDEDFDIDTHSPECFAYKTHMNVPSSRRVSSVTCSSADSAYLERRCSAFEMGLPCAPQFPRQSREKLAGKKEEPWDYYYPIDIQVIQPTPEMSPTASEKNLNEEQTISGLQVPGIQDQMHRLSVTSSEIGLAPLASISTLGSFGGQSSSIFNRSSNNRASSIADSASCACADDSVGSDSVFLDDMNMDDLDEFETDSEFEYDDFDDDYSFCESKQKPVSKKEMKTLQFASFDSYDASIGPESISGSVGDDIAKSGEEEKSGKQTLSRQHSGDFKRQRSLHDGTNKKTKLTKTYSEPKSNNRTPKYLPAWIERGRSGYVPKRQMSSPLTKKKNSRVTGEDDESVEKPKDVPVDSPASVQTEVTPNTKPSQEEGGGGGGEEDVKDLRQFLPPPSSNSSSSDSVTLTPHRSDTISTSTPIQGLHKELPFKNVQQLSLPSVQEKRSRLQKQKNFIEEVKTAATTTTTTATTTTTTTTIKEKTEAQGLTGRLEPMNLATTSKELLKAPNISLTGSCERLASPCLRVQFDEESESIRINLDSHENGKTSQQQQQQQKPSLSSGSLRE